MLNQTLTMGSGLYYSSQGGTTFLSLVKKKLVVERCVVYENTTLKRDS